MSFFDPALYDPVTGLPRRPGPRPGYSTYIVGGEEFQSGRPVSGAGGGVSPTGAASYNQFLKIPASRPDFMGVLNADPLLQQFKSGMGAEQVADRAQLTAARQRALAQFGLVPDLTNSLGIVGADISEDVTPETRALAEKNTKEQLSTVGRLNREFERVQQNIMDALAARGALRSGASGVALQDLQQERKTAMSDATQQLLDYLRGVQAAYVQNQRQRAGQLSAEQSAAAGRLDPNALAGTRSQQAVHIGDGIYRSPDGRLWNADGTPYGGPPPGGAITGPNDPTMISGPNTPTPAIQQVSRPRGIPDVTPFPGTSVIKNIYGRG